MADLALAPLIDCVFLLLIFFLICTMLKQESKDIDIDLPASISSLEVRPDDRISVIGIDREGKLYWEGWPTTVNLLHQQLREVSEREPGKRLRLDCDQRAPFHRVVEVLDICQFRDLRNVGVRTYDEKASR